MSRKYNFVRDSGKQATSEAFREISATTQKRRQKSFNSYLFALKTFLRNFEFDVQLYRGDGKYPADIKHITPFEMGKLNKEFEKSFMKKLDTNRNARLWKWKFVDYLAFKKIKDEYIDRNRGIYSHNK